MTQAMAQTVKIGALLGAWLVVTSPSGHADAAEMEFTPSLSVSEEYNDNIYETAHNRRSDFITRVQPGASFRYLSPLWKWDASYTFDYQHYARHSEGDEYNHNAMLRGTITLIENFLYVDLRDTYHRVSLDVTRDTQSESSLFLDQTDENRFTISPYLLWRVGQKGILKTGYRFSDVRYWGRGIERREHGAFADFTYELTPKLSLTTGYGFSRMMSDSTDYDKHDVYGGFKYEYADGSFIYGQAGNSWQQFDRGRSTDYVFWNAGITHDFSIFRATFETRVENSADPQGTTVDGYAYSSSIDPQRVSDKQTSYTGRIEKTFERGSLLFSTTYTEYDDTETGNSSRDKLAFNLSGRYEIMEKLNLSLSTIAEHTDYSSTDNYYHSNYPYRFVGSARLSYDIMDKLTVGLGYIYTTYLHHLVSYSDSREINRVILDIRKTF